MKLERILPVGFNGGIVVAPGGGHAYVPTEGPDQDLYLIDLDLTTGDVLRNLAIGPRYPFLLTPPQLSPDGSTLYVFDGASSLLAIDTQSFRIVATQSNYYAVTPRLSPDGDYIYLAGNNTIEILSAPSLQPVGSISDPPSLPTPPFFIGN